MCILFFVTNPNASLGEYKLILAANRDEFYVRPALTAAPWAEHSHVIGGRDMEPGREGGTWLAASAKDKIFKFGALLNITGENKSENAIGRGSLVSDFVAGSLSIDQYGQNLVNIAKNYNGFSLVTIEIGQNYIKPKLLCNAPEVKLLDWPTNEVLAFGNCPPPRVIQKVLAGQKIFNKIVHQPLSKDALVLELMNLLKNNEKHWPDDELLFRAPSWAEKLSSICVNIPEEGYGSRTHTVIIIDHENNVDFYEETLLGTNPDRDEWKKSHLTLNF